MEQVKPTVQLVGTDGNVYALLGRCTKALKRAGMAEEARLLTERVTSSKSYDEALCHMMEAVDAE